MNLPLNSIELEWPLARLEAESTVFQVLLSWNIKQPLPQQQSTHYTHLPALRCAALGEQRFSTSIVVEQVAAKP